MHEETFVVSVLVNGSSSSWSKITAKDQSEAVDKYIEAKSADLKHQLRKDNKATLIVGKSTQSGDWRPDIQGFGIQVFEVAPVPEPKYATSQRMF